ncbi:Nitrate/nitrite sensor protein [hydrothermal vent metagenome]|uniref:Oxygen sensor histidine kinase NreB n=1 Tax=hydrothermal vent metagenome TaxID=652676 RepID=A0A3B0YEM3_9ZZZZ
MNDRGVTAEQERTSRRRLPLPDWPTTRQFLSALSALGITLLVLGLMNIWDFLHAEQSNWLHFANSILLVGGIALIAFTFHVARRDLVAPLTELRHWVNEMHNGNLSARLPKSDQPDFSKLYKDINALAERLESLSLDLQSEVEQQTQRTQQKTHSLEILYDIAANINAANDLEDLLTRFLHTLKDVVDARAGTVRMLTDNGEMQLIASSGLDPEVVKQEKLISIDRCLCGQAAKHGEVYSLDDLTGCGQFAGRPFFESDNIEMIAVPLRYRGKVLGVYNLFTTQHGLVEREDMKDLLTSVGHHLGMAIEKSRLDEEANLLSIMEERTRLANELHDSLAQSLASLKFQVRVLDETLHSGEESALWEELERIENSLDEAYTELRELIAHFRAPMDKRGLIPAVEQAIERFRRNSKISAFLQLEWGKTKLPVEVEMQVLRIIQEALANIRKHSEANAVRVLMRAAPGQDFLVMIEDDGIGIQDKIIEGGPGEHLGLKILAERAARVRGDLKIESESGEGTRVTLTFPMPIEEPENDGTVAVDFPAHQTSKL